MNKTKSSDGELIRVFPITVDYSVSIERMIEIGKYDRVDTAITSKNYPNTKDKRGKEYINIQLISIRTIHIEKICKIITKEHYKLADIHMLLALGNKYPNIQADEDIIELGEVRKFGSILEHEDDFGYFACLHNPGSARYLSERYYNPLLNTHSVDRSVAVYK